MKEEGKRQPQGLDQGSHKKFTKGKKSPLSSRKMSNTIKGENKLEGASNYRSWKKRLKSSLKRTRSYIQSKEK